jgi:hypothetical protein
VKKCLLPPADRMLRCTTAPYTLTAASVTLRASLFRVEGLEIVHPCAPDGWKMWRRWGISSLEYKRFVFVETTTHVLGAGGKKMAATCWVWLVLPLQLPWGHLSDLRLAEISGPLKKCVCL